MIALSCFISPSRLAICSLRSSCSYTCGAEETVTWYGKGYCDTLSEVIDPVHWILGVNPNSLSYRFPLVVHVHVRVRANSGFDRGVGVRGRGR